MAMADRRKSIKYKKRPGCKSTTDISSYIATPRDAFLSGSGYMYVGGNNTTVGQVIAYDGSNIYTVGPTNGFGASVTMMNFADYRIATGGSPGNYITWLGVDTSAAPLYVPSASASEIGYYAIEADIIDRKSTRLNSSHT